MTLGRTNGVIDFVHGLEDTIEQRDQPFPKLAYELSAVKISLLSGFLYGF